MRAPLTARLKTPTKLSPCAAEEPEYVRYVRHVRSTTKRSIYFVSSLVALQSARNAQWASRQLAEAASGWLVGPQRPSAKFTIRFARSMDLS